MTRQTLLGFLFLLIGLGILAGCGIIITSMFSAHQWPPIIMLWLVLAGLGTALFGSFLLPNSGAAPTFNTILVSLSRSNLPFVGRRIGDRPSSDAPEVTTTTTTTSKEP